MRMLIVVMSLSLHLSANAETIAIIGTGNVGATIGAEFAEQGHKIIYGSRSPAGLKALDLARKTGSGASTDTPARAARAANIVVLAVPGTVAVDVARNLGDLTGKLVIDVTNPLQTDDSMHFSRTVSTSNGELLQRALDGAIIVKALNTVSWQLMASADELQHPVTVPLSGDDVEAKEIVAGLVEAMGFVTLDVGGIETAQWTEMTAVIMLNNRFEKRPEFNLYLRPAN